MFTAERVPPFDLRLQRKARMKRRFSKYFHRVLPAENICGFFRIACTQPYGMEAGQNIVFGLTSEISELGFVFLTETFCRA